MPQNVYKSCAFSFLTHAFTYLHLLPVSITAASVYIVLRSYVAVVVVPFFQPPLKINTIFIFVFLNELHFSIRTVLVLLRPVQLYALEAVLVGIIFLRPTKTAAECLLASCCYCYCMKQLQLPQTKLNSALVCFLAWLLIPID